MCDCMSRIPNDEKFKVYIKSIYPKKQFKNATFKEGAFLFNKSDLSIRLFNTIEVEFENINRKEKIEFVHTYCPFCGDKLPVLEGTPIKK